MRLVFAGPHNPGLNKFFADFASQIIWGDDRGFVAPYGTMAVTDDSNGVLAVVVFHNWDRHHGVIEVSAGSIDPRWLARRALFAIFDVCFNQHACQLTVMRIDPDDAPTRRMLNAYGFDELRLPRARGRDKDELLMTLTDDRWRASKWNRRPK